VMAEMGTEDAARQLREIAVGIVLLDLLVVGGSLGVAFAARADGWPSPATIGTACGPFLMSKIESVMRGRASR
jgi:hypothetical protein